MQVLCLSRSPRPPTRVVVAFAGSHREVTPLLGHDRRTHPSRSFCSAVPPPAGVGTPSSVGVPRHSAKRLSTRLTNGKWTFAPFMSRRFLSSDGASDAAGSFGFLAQALASSMMLVLNTQHKFDHAFERSHDAKPFACASTWETVALLVFAPVL